MKEKATSCLQEEKYFDTFSGRVNCQIKTLPKQQNLQ
jgi:hypothetical protein